MTDNPKPTAALTEEQKLQIVREMEELRAQLKARALARQEVDQKA